MRFAAFSTPRKTFALIVVLAVLPLAGALLSQYGFGYAPCKLCMWQRYPYAAMLVWACVARGAVVRPRVALLIAALLAQISGGIALFHAGVEAGWWVYESSCTSALGGAQTLDALRNALNAAPLVACDQPMLEIAGLSMAAWNVLYALCSAIILCACAQDRK